MVKTEKIGNYNENISIYCLENEYISMKVTDLGCRILELWVPDREGRKRDIVLGLKDLSDNVNDSAYFGAIVGRVCNRTKNASFTLNGVTYKLAENNSPNHLHGGPMGFDKRIFEARTTSKGMTFHRMSPDGEEGYPGNLDLTIDYILEDNTFTIRYFATTDKDTPVSLTNHVSFNLEGQDKTVLDHFLKVDADKVCCIDDHIMATGEIVEVEGSVFDFRKGKKIAKGIDPENDQIKNANGGIDHHFIFNEVSDGSPQIELWSEETGIKVAIGTSAPGVQVYTGNFFAQGCAGKTGKPYGDRTGVALETQFMPNAINSDHPECVILRKGKEYRSETKYTFTTL